MTASAVVFLVAAATILAALAFEHFGGYAPCPLCLEERYAYYFAVPASALAFLLARGQATGLARIVLVLIALAFLANAVAGIYHAGIEWKWWPGPGECSGAFELQWGEGGIVGTPVIRCDEASGVCLASPLPAGMPRSRRSSPVLPPMGRRAGASSQRLQASVIGGRRRPAATAAMAGSTHDEVRLPRVFGAPGPHGRIAT